MGTDKSLLQYHGQPQRYHLYDMLQDLCTKVYLSCNQEQYPSIPHSYHPLPDDPTYGDIGPMAALLTAFHIEPQASFLVVGCDYPLLQKKDLDALVTNASETNSSVAYFNPESRFLEPLLAVYHHSILPSVIKSFEAKEHSLRRILEQEGIKKLTPESPERIMSVDTWEEYEEVLKEIS